MLSILLPTLAVFGLAAAGLGLGLMFGRTAPKGSCGGSACDACITCPNRRPGPPAGSRSAQWTAPRTEPRIKPRAAPGSAP